MSEADGQPILVTQAEQELEDLSRQRNRLMAYMDSAEFAGLHPEIQQAMRSEHDAMGAHRFALEERIRLVWEHGV